MSETIISEELPQIQIQTDRGEIILELFEDEAPNTVANMISLTEQEFYNGLIFHRVIPNFMIQCGCPHGTGTGDPGYRFDDECTPERRHDGPGVLSMANAGPGTNGSQFFITHEALEADVQSTLRELRNLKEVRDIGALIRVIAD